MQTVENRPQNGSERDISTDETAHDVTLPEVARVKLKRYAVESARRRSGRRPSPERRLKILEAALQLFTMRDYHEVLMEHVAERARVGKGTLYRYFPTKEALFLELVNMAMDRVTEVIREGFNTAGPAIQRLRRAAAMTVEYFRINRPLLQILYQDKVFRCCREKEGLKEKRAALRGFFARLLAECIAEGSMRDDMEPALGANMLTSSIQGLLRNYGTERTSQQLADQLLSIFIDGAAPRAEPKAPARSAVTAVPALDPGTKARLDPLASLKELDGFPSRSKEGEDAEVETENNDGTLARRFQARTPEGGRTNQ